MAPLFTAVVTWDSRTQPDWQAIHAILQRHGVQVGLTPVSDPGGEEYALVLSERPIPQWQAEAAYASHVQRAEREE